MIFGKLTSTSRFRRSGVCLVVAVLGAIGLSAGCSRRGDSAGELEAMWGKQGLGNGRFQKPRAIAIDSRDRLYIVDMTARIQVFDSEGKFLQSWRTPVSKNGRPTGLSIDNQGRLAVADTHYYRVLFYTSAGELLEEETIGGTMGHGEGEFGFLTDVVQDSSGNYYVAEYGQHDRIQKFSPEGKFLLQWGTHGEKPGQFRRPQSLWMDAQDRLWVADSCNHRIQVFDTQGELQFHWGRQGDAIGELYYPYCLALDADGQVWVCEYGNHRIQKFTQDGQSLGTWGRSGRGEGELFNPWAFALDSKGRLHVLDSSNHRVQRVRM
jgi:DNA-binding beta-propeller fold protein YncE